ncbi:hypothetical protein N7489_005047 [Penicillium chrysogenum]|uniref:uncharacterized protein n=1 Tax=Penicillium chrysogenum TaxID=5076 RepID=UPI0024DF0F15|nr:uncharacterized protein N7489_005047 [Penicillium chrysogenum]KAJ5244951.1 hypothetical protein N7489_005047 [Penicillium chrysogenum]
MDISVFGQPEISPVLDSEKLRLQYCEAEKRLLVFDYDGTLTPLVKNPEEATLSTQALHSITTLSADPRNSVWIVSGRDQKFLHEQVGHIPELGLSAEHGCFIRKPHSDSWESLIGQTDLTWQTEVTKVFQRFTARTKGSFTERKRVAVTWHYPQADPEEGAHLAQECLNLLEETVVGKRSVVVMPGKANLEVRPTCVNKGSVVTRLVDENLIAPGRQYGYILCAGDDHTDEDMFRALQRDVPTERICTITVGPTSKRSAAKWSIPNPAEIFPPRIRHLLWQRQQKSATANAFFKRRHIAHEMRDIQEYPGPKVNTKEMALGLTTPLPTTVPGSTM